MDKTEKRLTAKVQKLSPIPDEQSPDFSGCVIIDPEDKKQILQKGVVYSVFSVAGDVPLDVKVISSVVEDVLRDVYYSADTVSSVQNLEKAILEVRNKVSELPGGGAVLREQNIKFSILGCVLWGNVLYVVQQGTAQSFLVRGGELRPIQSMGEGDFSAASGVIKDDDVVILCTDAFAKRFPPEKLLSLSMSEQDLEPNQSCLLLKFIIDSSISDKEIAKLTIPDATPKERIEKAVENFAAKLNKPKLRTPSKPSPASGPVVGLPGLPKIGVSSDRGSGSLISKILSPRVVLPFVGVALIVGAFYFVNQRKTAGDGDALEPFVDVSITGEQSVSEIPADQVPTVDTHTFDQRDNVTRITVEDVLYDIKIDNAEADPKLLNLVDGALVLIDSSSGKVWVSPAEEIKFEEKTTSLKGAKRTAVDDKKQLVVSTSSGFTFYDPNGDAVNGDYALENPGVFDVYLDFVYAISNDTLLKYKKSDGELVDSVWAQSADFAGAQGMHIAYNIYILTAENDLVSYTTGKKNTFALEGLDKSLNAPTSVKTEASFDNVYILDPGNNRVVVVDSEGKFVKQFRHDKEDEWSALRAITVSSNESTLYVLNGSKIFKIDL